ncbi:5-methyltetrahydropteroyltriglutamate--homocysteine S-methyltransferase [Pseudorhodoplanes sp.]|uniref:5-methyltetrahydropteroyltriglutamate-- homocysteine S-methyltransferase n=1 Tax=Pseudorhodoplanes sp. TaxID=1934341 RepID=UPI00391C04F5
MTTLPQGRPPFRADHIGSLLRPQVLRQAFRDYAAKRLDDAAFAKIQDDCIRDVVTMQEEVGLKVVTDGEFRRGSYWGRFVERIDGFAIKPAVFKFRDDAGHQVDFTAPYAQGKLKRNKPLALDEYEFLKGITGATAKITLPAPSTMHFYRATDFADRAAYADTASFFADLNRIFREEIADLAKAGCKYIQLDEVAIALLCDPAIRKQVEACGMTPDDLVDLYINAINESVKGAPDDVIFGVHMCRGNFKGHYIGAGGYESVAERFFSETRVNHFLLEYDTERAGDFRPLRFVKGKGVVLGLISSKTPVLESLDGLQRRVEEATQFIDLDRLAISPQCGFASTVAGNPVTETDERRKLELEVKAAQAIWG